MYIKIRLKKSSLQMLDAASICRFLFRQKAAENRRSKHGQKPLADYAMRGGGKQAKRS
ncbi:MAG: hypothetical protein NC250_06650 [Alistipes senegalensis]|nr:hypothetical protein [Alistipes senegalensis]